VSRRAQVRSDHTRSKLAPTAVTLLDSARQKLAAGERDTSAGRRYVAAHLAALRAAAAVVAAKSEPEVFGRRKRPRNVWELLPRVEPALSGWAAYFAAVTGASKPRGLGRAKAVSRRQADTLLGDAKAFVSVAEGTLRVTAQQQQALTQSGPTVTDPEAAK
jgi:SAV_6107-like HEPN